MSLTPLYVKHSVLGANRYDSELAYRLCMAVSAIVPGHVLGARQIRGLWEIQVKSSVARDKLLNSGFIFKEKKMFLHATDPFLSQNIPSEKIIFLDVPFDCNNSHIMNYLRTQPQIRIRSDVITGKIRNANNELTEFLNGDRYVYVEAGFSPVLEQETTINGHTCRIWHSNQAMKCKRCSGDNHRTTDAVECPAYIDEPEDVIIFWESKHVFSNFYMCNIKLFDLDFKSAEHCYQYCKLRYIGQDELAQEILLCDTPRQAKQIAMKIPGHLMIQWHEQKCNAMYQILCAKAKCCAKFKDALIRSDKKIIAEGTVDTFWGIGMPGCYAKNTNPEYLCGHNRLGMILMDVRKNLLDELLASSQTPPPVSCLNRVISETPMSSTASVSDVPNSSTNAPTIQDNNPRSETPVTESTSGSHQAGHSKNAQSMELSVQDSQIPSTSGANQDGNKSHSVDKASTRIGDIQLEATQMDVTQGVTTEQSVPDSETSSVAKSTSAGSMSSSKASIADEISEAELVQKRTPATVRRRIPKNTPKHQKSDGPMDNFLQKLKRKLSPEKETDTASVNQKQQRSDKAKS